jgi:hypothetical protein
MNIIRVVIEKNHPLVEYVIKECFDYGNAEDFIYILILSYDYEGQLYNRLLHVGSMREVRRSDQNPNEFFYPSPAAIDWENSRITAYVVSKEFDVDSWFFQNKHSVH